MQPNLHTLVKPTKPYKIIFSVYNLFHLIIYFALCYSFKIWISNGGWADVMTVFARTYITDDKVLVICFSYSSRRKLSFLVYTLGKIKASFTNCIYRTLFVPEWGFPYNN